MTDLEQKLLCRIQKVHCFGIDTENTETILESVNHPEWSNAGKYTTGVTTSMAIFAIYGQR